MSRNDTAAVAMAVANSSVKVADNMQASSPLSTRLASFAHVRFCNVPETYPLGSDVECTYVISDKVEVSSRDWVGLYKVGWRAASDYTYYMWSPLPADCVPGQEVANHVTFPGECIFGI
jgi:SKICH domain